MLSSQQDATAAALCYLRIGFTTVDTVASTEKGTPAYGVLKKGDDITAVDGTPVDCQHNVVAMIRDRRPGSNVTLTILRGGQDQDHHARRPRTSTASRWSASNCRRRPTSSRSP